MKNTMGFLLLAALSGCAAAPAPAPIYVGHVATTSGPRPAVGLQEVQGIRLALEDLKSAGQNLVNDRPVAVRHADASGAIDAFEGEAVRLATVSRVVALYGGNTDEEVIRLSRGRVPLLTPLGDRPAGASDLVFASGMSLAAQAHALARFAVEEKDIRTIVILADETREQARRSADAFDLQFQKAFAAKHPKESVAKPTRLTFGKQRTIADLAAQVDAKSQAVMLAGTNADLSQWRKARPKDDRIVLFGGEDGSLREAGPNIYAASAFALDKASPKTVDFARQYREAFKEEADVHAALAYEGMHILVEALRRAPSPASDALAAELRTTKDYAGLAGPLTFGTDQQLRRPIFIGQMAGGVFTAVKRYDAP